jgi:hypothetical protein
MWRPLIPSPMKNAGTWILITGNTRVEFREKNLLLTRHLQVFRSQLNLVERLKDKTRPGNMQAAINFGGLSASRLLKRKVITLVLMRRRNGQGLGEWERVKLSALNQSLHSRWGSLHVLSRHQPYNCQYRFGNDSGQLQNAALWFR